MAEIIRMPELLTGVNEVTITTWVVSEGATVAKGATLAEAETEKAVVDLPAEQGGVVGKLLVHEGQSVQVGEPMAVILESADEEFEVPNSNGAESGRARNRNHRTADTGSARAPRRRTRGPDASGDPGRHSEPGRRNTVVREPSRSPAGSGKGKRSRGGPRIGPAWTDRAQGPGGLRARAAVGTSDCCRRRDRCCRHRADGHTPHGDASCDRAPAFRITVLDPALLPSCTMPGRPGARSPEGAQQTHQRPRSR